MAKKQAFNPDDDDDIDRHIEEMLNEQRKAADKKAKIFKGERHVYTTGLLPLDLNINPEHPGIMGGNIIQLCGRGHSGKTTMALSIAKHHMDQGHKVLYLDPECGLTDEMIKDWGYYKNHPLFRYERYSLDLEEGGNYHRYFSTACKYLAAYQGSNKPFILIIDSIGYLRPVKTDWEAGDGPRVGGNIPIFNEFLKSFVPLVGNTNGLAIFINGVYEDNKNKYNDYVIPGGADLERASELILVHYQRANDTGGSISPWEKTFNDVTKNFAKPYKQKLGVKIKKNKWHHTVTKQSAMDFFLTTDPAFDNGFGLDNTRAMLMFLKENNVLTGSGYYSLGEDKRLWKDWEHSVNNDEETFYKIFNKVKETFVKLNNGEV